MNSPAIVESNDASRVRLDVVERDEAKLQRRSRRLAIVAVVACPCHLPLVATVLALVGFGGAAAALRDNFVLAFVVFGAVAIASLWWAVRASRAASACRLPTPPAAHTRDVASEP